MGYRISIISIRYPTIRFDLIDKVKMSICRVSMTSLENINHNLLALLSGHAEIPKLFYNCLIMYVVCAIDKHVKILNKYYTDT